MKIFEELFKINLIKEQEVMCILFSHETKTLNDLFYDLIYTNVPKDILQEPDQDYIKSNICRVLTYYIIQIWNGKSVNLNDKMFKCVKCGQWAYFKTPKKNICIFCFQVSDGGNSDATNRKFQF